MLQVPPAGPPPSRPALKAQSPDPAEEGFPALALLAAVPGQPPPPAEDPPTAPSKPTREAGGVQSIQAPGEPAVVSEGAKQESPGAAAPQPNDVGATASPLSLKPEASLIAADLGLSLVPPGPAVAVGPALPPGPQPSPPTLSLPALVPAGPLPPTAANPPVPPEGSNLAPIPVKGVMPSEILVPGKAEPSPPEPFSLPSERVTVSSLPIGTSTAPIRELPVGRSIADPAFATMTMEETSFARAELPSALTAQVSKVSVSAGEARSRKAEPVPAQASVSAESAPVARPVPRGQRPVSLAFEPVREAPQPAGFFASTQDTFALPQSGVNLSVRLASPTAPGTAVPGTAVPGKPPEGAAPVKETAKPVEPARGSEDSKPQPVEATTSPAESTPATQGTKDPAPALPRSESLGLQPTQPQPASSQGIPANISASKPTAPVWQAPVPAVLHQVENGIRWMLQNASPGAELQLHPEALGRVRIELKVEGGEVHARLWASDPKSIPVLQENKAFLEVSLKEQGLNLGSFDLRQHSNQPQPQNPEGQPKGQFWPTEATLVDHRQDAPSGQSTTGRNPRRVELIA